MAKKGAKKVSAEVPKAMKAMILESCCSNVRKKELLQLCQENPLEREDLEPDSLPLWEDVPLDCKFRVKFPSHRGVQRRATDADKLAQRQGYAKCKAWALQCGLSEEEFTRKIKGVPPVCQRGRVCLPPSLRHWHSHCSSWEHAKREIMMMALAIAKVENDEQDAGVERHKKAGSQKGTKSSMRARDHRKAQSGRLLRSWQGCHRGRLSGGGCCGRSTNRKTGCGPRNSVP